MHADRESTAEEASPTWTAHRLALGLLALVYFTFAGFSADRVVVHAQASTDAIDHILNLYNLKNESAKTLASYTKEHPLLGFFLGDSVRDELKLPSDAEASHALYTEVGHHLKTVRLESSSAAWWSWALITASFLYIVLVIALERSFTDRAVLFALNCVALVCFAIGIIAPAMIIWTSPSIPLESGNLEFVVQHEIRGIAVIIWDLLKNGHGLIGGFLLLFSIITPLTKSLLTFFVVFTRDHKRNHLIGEFLHTIGKWSMADVFVAAVLLALYALKFQEATKSIPCLGLYYFIGYCLLSLTTTELLVHSAAVSPRRERSRYRAGGVMITGLFAGFLCFAGASSLYTYKQYTENTKQKIKPAATPQKLDNADLVLPAHH